jgi:FkbM family methyltransferase
MAVTYLPPKRRGLRVGDLSERWFGRPKRCLTGVHQSGYWVLCDLADSVQRSIFYSGTYEPRLTALVEAELRPGDVFLDLGANIGHFSLLAARKLGVHAQIHAVEPSQQTAVSLKETLRRNRLDQRITVHQVAAFDRSDQMVLATMSDSAWFMASRYLSSGSEAGETVQVVRMDDYLTVQPTVVKIDVEGADLRALVGMERLLRKSPPRCLFVEAIDNQLARFGDSTAAMIDYMKSFGYHVQYLFERYYPDSVVFRLDT